METSNDHIDSQEIDIFDLMRDVWSWRKVILKWLITFFVLGVVYALMVPKQFNVKTTMIPQLGQGGSVGSGLSGLASLAGVNIGEMGDTKNDISPQLYPEIINSIPFQLTLLNQKVILKGIDYPLTYKEYLTNHTLRNPINTVKKYTIGLPGIIIESFKKNEELNDIQPSSMVVVDSLYRLSRVDFELINSSRRALGLSIDKKTNKVTLTVILTDPVMATQIAKRALSILQEFVIEFRVAKAKQEFLFIDKLFEEKRREYELIQDSLSAFQDANRNITTASARAELNRLEGDYELSVGVYSEVAKQRETAKIEIQKNIPTFSIIQPASVPLEKSKPSRIKIIFVSILLGFFLSITYMFSRKILRYVTAKVVI